jgi:hypothetical protein
MVKSKSLILILLISILPSTGVGQTQQSAPAPKTEPSQATTQEQPSDYASLLARVKSGDLTIDFKQLRFSWIDSPERHKAKDTNEEKEKMFVALNSKDFKNVIKNGDVVLEQEFVDMDTHFAEFIAYRELQDKPKADFHQAVFAALLRSITDNGDGKSTKTAYVVISVHEEYVVLRTMGLQPGKQSVANENGHSYDRLETRSRETGATVVVYFNVDIPFKHYLN